MSDVGTVGSQAQGQSPQAGQPASRTSRLAFYPSEVIKPIPSFVFSVPEGWVVDEAPDALAVVRLPQQVDGFWINALLSHDRVPRSVDFKQAAQLTWARLKQANPDAKPEMERLARFDANVVYLRGVEVKAPQSGRSLAQLHALFFAPAPDEGKTVDFFQFIGTSPSEHMERFGPNFVEMIGSFRFI